MRTVTPQQLAELQRKPANIRNICILAHVDHGKTTLADSLISSNGIISSRLAGKMRYMDSREDEQLRGITMKSSAITLHCNQGDDEYLVNLIDSPGHVDFSSEVSTAVRLCDGALVVIDVVEGVCPQTHVVLRQAWLEHIKPCLVLNKIDRLVSELKYTPTEAHFHLQQLLEQVNAVVGNLFASDVLEKASMKSNGENAPPFSPSVSKPDQVYDWSDGLEETDDSHIYFSPDQGNVIFASAIDGWGFSINQFAELYASKLSVKPDILRKTLWGDFYLNSKTKRIMKGAQAKGKKPMFVQFVLDNIWALYETVLVRRDKEKVEKIIKSLNLKVPARDMRNNDPKVHLQAICNQWIPVAKAVLDMVCVKLPSPLEINEERIEKLMCSSGRSLDSLPQQTQDLKTAFQNCVSDDNAPVIVYVSKMFAVDHKTLPQNRQRPLTTEELEHRRQQARQRHAERKAAAEAAAEATLNADNIKGTSDKQETSSTKAPEEPKSVSFSNHNEIFVLPDDKAEKEQDDIFVAFARVFSGTLRRGKKLLVLGPKHDPHKALEGGEEIENVTEQTDVSNLHITEFTVSDLYMLMGRELELLEEVPAGNVLGIGGLERLVLKSATLSSTVACPAFTAMSFAAQPIVRVAIEPQHLSEMPALLRGLKLLNQADPCVQVLLQETGEHVIVAAGEVHLERCLDDLRKRFAKIEIDVSAPIIPFRETIIVPPKIDMVNEVINDINMIQRKNKMGEDFESEGIVISKDRQLQIQTSNKKCMFHIRAMALPENITRLLEENAELIRIIDQYTAVMLGGRPGEQLSTITLTEATIGKLQELKQKMEAAFGEAGKKWRNAINQIWSFGPKRYGPNILLNRIADYDRPNIWKCLEKDGDDKPLGSIWEFDNSIVSGFQLATLAGPLCEEPMTGVCFAIEHWQIEGAKHNSVLISNSKRTKGVLVPQSQSTDVSATCEVNGTLQRTSNENLDIVHPSDSTIDPSSITDCDHIDRTPVGSPELSSPIGSPSKGSLIPRVYGGHLSGQIIFTVKEGCRISFQVQPQRLMAAMYKCDIQCTAEALGRMYGVVSKRNGQVLQEEMREGSPIFDIAATLPVAESFGFVEEIRKRTSGLASPQLFFSHWEVIPSDPYWVPSTEEELLHFGEKADYENQARKYMNDVRRRKGLFVEEKTVEFAQKQRTLSKNK